MGINKLQFRSMDCLIFAAGNFVDNWADNLEVAVVGIIGIAAGASIISIVTGEGTLVKTVAAVSRTVIGSTAAVVRLGRMAAQLATYNQVECSVVAQHTAKPEGTTVVEGGTGELTSYSSDWVARKFVEGLHLIAFILCPQLDLRVT